MYQQENCRIMSLKLFVIPLLTIIYVGFELQQTDATFLVESATSKALIQSACSACDSPPACYAVLNPIANHPNLNPTDICTVAVQAAHNVAKITYRMLNASASLAVQIAPNPAVQQSISFCTQEYAQVLDQLEKAANAFTQKVDQDKVPEFLNTAIGAIAKCDASAVKVANSAVQITTKNFDCSKMLKNALGIYKVFSEYIENRSHDPKEITGSVVGNVGGNFDFNAGGGGGGVGGGGGGGGIIGLSAPTRSPKISTNMKFEGLGLRFGERIKGMLNPDSQNLDSGSSAGEPQSENTHGLGLRFGERIKGMLNPDSQNLDSGSSAGAPQSENTPPQISTNMKFEGLGLRFGERIKGMLNPDSQNLDSGSSAGAPESGNTQGLGLRFGERIKGMLNPDSQNLDSGSNAGAPQSGNTPPQISTNMKFEGLGLGFGERIKGYFHHDSANTGSGSSGNPSQTGSNVGAPQTGIPPSPISTNTKFEGLGLGLGQRFKGLFNPGSQNTDSRSSAGAPQTGSPPLKTSSNMKYEETLGFGFGKRIKGFLTRDFETADSNADELPSGSIAGPPVNTGMKFSLSGFAKSFTSGKKNREHEGTGSPSPAPASAPSSKGGTGSPSPAPATAPSSEGSTTTPSPPVDSDASSPDDAAISYTDYDLNDGNDSPTPSPSGNNVNEVSLKYSLSHLIPDT